jgi:uridine phosphorylase
MKRDYPILEYDTSRAAALDPKLILRQRDTMPEHVVFCFFQDVLKAVCKKLKAPVLFHLGSEIGKNPVYLMEMDGRRIAVTHPGVGAPLASTFMEELIAFGGRVFMACGGSGVLNSSIVQGHVIIPSAAVRDEGTSYHYLPPAREVQTDPRVVSAIEGVLAKHSVPYDIGKTWTTDAPYRETYGKVALRRDEGCLTVEMETAAFLAVAQFRGATFGQILYGGDDVGGEVWNNRGWQRNVSTREKLFWLALEAVLALPEAQLVE